MCKVRNLNVDDYTPKTNVGDELNVNDLIGDLILRKNEIVLEPAGSDGPPPPGYIPSAPPVAPTKVEEKIEPKIFLLPYPIAPTVIEIELKNVLPIEQWRFVPLNKNIQVPLLLDNTLAKWSKANSWCLLRGDKPLKLDGDHCLLFEIEKLWGDSQNIHVGFCQANLDSTRFLVENIDKHNIQGSFLLSKVRPPVNIGTKIGVVITPKKNILIYRNYKIIEQIEPTNLLMFYSNIYPFIAINHNADIRISPVIHTDLYSKLEFTDHSANLYPILPPPSSYGLKEVLDVLKIERYRTILAEYTLKTLTLESMDKLGIPRHIQQSIWRSCQQILNYCEMDKIEEQPILPEKKPKVVYQPDYTYLNEDRLQSPRELTTADLDPYIDTL